MTIAGAEVMGRPWSHPCGEPGHTPGHMISLPRTAAEWQGRTGFTPDHLWSMETSVNIQPEIGSRTITSVLAGSPANAYAQPSPYATRIGELDHGEGNARLAVSGTAAFLEDNGATDVLMVMEGYFPDGGATYLWSKRDGANAGYVIFRNGNNTWTFTMEDDLGGGKNATDNGFGHADRAIMAFGYSTTSQTRAYLITLTNNGQMYASDTNINLLTGSFVNPGFALSNVGNSLGARLGMVAGFDDTDIDFETAKTLVRNVF